MRNISENGGRKIWETRAALEKRRDRRMRERYIEEHRDVSIRGIWQRDGGS